jgi:hypothetical protein
VDVGLDDESDAHPAVMKDLLDTIEVALGVDDDSDAAVMHDVASVAQFRCLNTSICTYISTL